MSYGSKPAINFTCAIFALSLALASTAPATATMEKNQTANAEQELTTLATNYAKGFYATDPSGVIATTHLELSKKGAGPRFWGLPKEYLEWLQGDRLALAGKYHDYKDEFDENTPSRVVVHNIDGNVAALELIAANWYDAFTAVHVESGWLLLDCVWGEVPEYEEPSQDNGEAAEFQSLLTSFARGLAAHDRRQLDEVIHPNISTRSLVDGQNGMRVQPITREQLYTGDHAALPKSTSLDTIDISVFNVTKRTAIGRIDVGSFTYFVQALKINDKWQIVNVHWMSE